MSILTPSFQAGLRDLIEAQRLAFHRDGFPEAGCRRARLNRLDDMLLAHGGEIAQALSEDFGHRSHDETRDEIGCALSALRTAAANVERWMAPAPVADAARRVERGPLGVVGVIAPWSFPIITLFGPLAAIVAAGNRAIVKPSERIPRTAQLLARLIADRFDPAEIAVVQGGIDEGASFAAAAFDHIVFTGSQAAARHILRAAATHLTPVTVELGGKSPAIVTADADLEAAAARIMAAKIRNAGQSCLAPDHVFVPQGREPAFAAACRRAVRAMLPDGVRSPHYTAIVSDRHYRRLARIVEDAQALGAEVGTLLEGSDAERRLFAPTLLLEARLGMMALQEEIFGPVLPVVGYRELPHVFGAIGTGPRPPALSYFGRDDVAARRALAATASGGVAINAVMGDTPMFAGTGRSGMGACHGRAGFETFSHTRPVYRRTGHAREEAA